MTVCVKKFADAIDTLRQRPVSALQLATESGMAEETSRRYINEMRDRGWIEVAGYEDRPQGIKPAIWRWKQ